MYTQLLVNGLLDRGLVEFASVLTEQHPDVSNTELLRNGQLQILRRFPFRAGVPGRSLFRYFQYVIQNIHFLAIPWAVYRLRISHLLIHSSFHNYPNLMWLSVRIVKAFMPSVRLIADVRDPKLPESRFGEISTYHWIICCSENVTQFLAKSPRLIDKLVSIPVVVDVKKPTNREVLECKAKYGLESVPYLFNGSGISKEKGIDKALETVKLLRSRKSDLCLVVAGKKRDWARYHDEAEKAGLLRYIGTIPHRDVLLLSSGAQANINLSCVDSMPRATLEALAAGAKVLLPKGIPEFDRECPEYVVASDNSADIAEQIQVIISGDRYPGYDISPHLPDRVFSQYGILLRREI